MASSTPNRQKRAKPSRRQDGQLSRLFWIRPKLAGGNWLHVGLGVIDGSTILSGPSKSSSCFLEESALPR